MSASDAATISGRLIAEWAGGGVSQTLFPWVNELSATPAGITCSITASGAGNPDYAESVTWENVEWLRAIKHPTGKIVVYARYVGVHGPTVLALRAKPDKTRAFIKKASALGGAKVASDPSPL